MKNLLLSLCFVSITSLIFCQTPTPENTQIHLKYYAHNCVPRSSINDAKKSIGNESAILPYKSLPHIATGYIRLNDYSTVCSIGQNTWRKPNRVAGAWRWLDGSIRSLGFRSGYSVATGVRGKISVLYGQLSPMLSGEHSNNKVLSLPPLYND
jgi:hypothetical protein